MASPEFSTAEWRTLDDVLSLLRSPQPWFASVPAGRLCAACPKRSPHLILSPPDLLAVSGNWYDVLHKAPVPNNLSSMVCPARDWNGGHRGRPGCAALAMTDASVEMVRRIWANAPEWTGPLPENDDAIG